MLNKAKLPKVNTIQERGRIIKSVNFDLLENKYRTLNLKDILSGELNLDELLNKIYTSFRSSHSMRSAHLFEGQNEFVSQTKGSLSHIVARLKVRGGYYMAHSSSGFLPKVQAKLYNLIFNSIKYKNLNGIRMEVKGRLTPRYRADRSVFKLR